MNKLFKLIIAGFITTGILMTGMASFADSASNSIQVVENSVNIKVNGVLINAPNFIYNRRTYIQLRSICELLGKSVSWDASTHTININDISPKISRSTGGTGSSSISKSGDPLLQDKVYYAGPATYPKEVALTFDDGPDTHYTQRILDILKKNNIKATFFIVGTRAEAHPELVRQIAMEGHAIGNHSWDHPLLTKLTPAQVKYEVDESEKVLHSILGYYPSMFRPPYGAATPDDTREITSMGYSIIDWSVDTRDWAGTPTPQIMNYVKKELHPGGIILEHCATGKTGNLDNTVRALPKIISSLKAQGYKFVTVPELLHIDHSNGI